MYEEDALFVAQTLQEFGVTDLSEDIFNAMERQDLEEFCDGIDKLKPITEKEITNFKKIRKIVNKWQKSENEDMFWVSLRSQGIFPDKLEALCLIIMQCKNNEDYIFEGVLLFSTLLSSQVASQIWNAKLYQPILSVLLSAASVLENGSNISPEIKKKLQNSISILNTISISMSKQYLNRIGIDMFIALCEVIVKLASGFRAEYDQINNQIQTNAFKILSKMMELEPEYVYPQLVPWSLLYFASSTSSMNSRLEALRDRIYYFLKENIKPEDPNLSLFIRHLILRAPEKNHLRRSASSLIFSLMRHIKDKVDIIEFVLKAAKGGKAGLRAFCDMIVVQIVLRIDKLIENNDELRSDYTGKLVSVIKDHVRDRAPTVRAIALDGLCSIISALKTHVDALVIKQHIDTNKFMMTLLTARCTDEKLIVRRAALQCVSEIIRSSDKEPNDRLVQLVVNRIRDWSVSVRQSAIRILGELITIYPDNVNLHKEWLNSIMPLIGDQEQSVQNEATEAMKKFLINPLIQGSEERFTEIMEDQHFEYLLSVFRYMYSKSIDLGLLSRSLTKYVINRDDEMNTQYWRIIEILVQVVPDHFRKISGFAKIWNRKELLPPQYYGTLAILKYSNPVYVEEVIEQLNGSLEEERMTTLMIHNYVKFLKAQKENQSTELIWRSLIKVNNDLVNHVALDPNGEFGETYHSYVRRVYLLGELILMVNNSNILGDYDFSGIKLLIGEELPNHNPIPPEVRAASTLALGKLCLRMKSVSNSYVSVFSKQLKENTPAQVKANCIIILSDICVNYSAFYSGQMDSMKNCIADRCGIVRHQALQVLTRLIVENYIFMEPMLFFRYVYAITDPRPATAEFARSCLFNVIASKNQQLLYKNFIDAMFYFNNPHMLALNEENSTHALFKLDAKRRMKAYKMLLANMNELSVFKLIQDTFDRAIAKFVKFELKIDTNEPLLEDIFACLNLMEEKLTSSTKSEANTDDSETEKRMESGKAMIAQIHRSMITNILPALNNLHRIVREANSPIQSSVRRFYHRLCKSDPALLDELSDKEPLLAIELRNEMAPLVDEEDEEEEPLKSPAAGVFNSPLLNRISNTPLSLLCSPARRQTENLNLVTPKRLVKTKEMLSTPPHKGQLQLSSDDE